MEKRTKDWAIGNPAPPLSLPLASGGSIALDQLKGQAVLLSFLSHAA